VAQKTITVSITKDARVYGAGGGAGASQYLPVGLSGGNNYVSLLQANLPNATTLKMLKVISATLRLKETGQVLVTRGGSPRVKVQILRETWTEGTSAENSTSNAVTWANQPDSTSFGEIDSGPLPGTDFANVSIDMTAMFRRWMPTTVENGEGYANYGFRLISYDMASTSRTDEFYSSDHPDNPPYITLVYEDNTAPDAPTVLAPATNDDGSATFGAFVTGRTVRFSMARVDIDPGDYITASQVQIYADTADDTTPGTVLIDNTKTFTGLPTSVTHDVDCTALTIGTKYRARMRTRDRVNVWGAWSSLLDARFIPDSTPSAPSNMAVDVATQSPNFYGTLVDADAGATLSAARILVYQDTSTGAILKWDSGWDTVAGGTRFTLAYGGSTLDLGTRYRWAAQVADEFGAQGPLSAYQSWTPVSTTGPDNMTPRTVETKQNSLTPTLTVGHSSGFTNHQLEVAKYPDPIATGDYLWRPAVGAAYASTTTKAVTYAGSALTWGRTFYWRSKVFVGGTTWTEWSPWYPFYINALPLAPVGTVDGAANSGTGIYGPYVTTLTTTPTLRFPYNDPDRAKGYTDNPTRREIEIIRADTLAAISGSPFIITSSITDTYTTAALTSGVTYKARARYDDSANQRSGWSEYVVFKVLTSPGISAGTAPSASDPTPTLAWSLSRAQRRFRVYVFVNATGELVHDSGLVDSTTQSYVVPGGVLETATTYRWTVTAYDDDLLSATLA
jgi:hypothetical protein